MQSEMSLWAGISGNHLNLLLKAELKVIQGPVKQNVQFLALSHRSEMHPCIWNCVLEMNCVTGGKKKTNKVDFLHDCAVETM